MMVHTSFMFSLKIPKICYITGHYLTVLIDAFQQNLTLILMKHARKKKINPLF